MKFFKTILAAIALSLIASPALAQSPAYTPVAPSASPTVTGSRILKPIGGVLHAINVTTGATAGYVMIFDSATVPPDGTVAPSFCIPVAINTGITHQFVTPMLFQSGIVMVFSTSGCFTKAISATAFLEGQFR
jgi:hypothetical protein